MPVGFSTPQLLDSSTREFWEQSENVYENKEQGQNVMASQDHSGFPREELQDALRQSGDTVLESRFSNNGRPKGGI